MNRANAYMCVEHFKSGRKVVGDHSHSGIVIEFSGRCWNRCLVDLFMLIEELLFE